MGPIAAHGDRSRVQREVPMRADWMIVRSPQHGLAPDPTHAHHEQHQDTELSGRLGCQEASMQNQRLKVPSRTSGQSNGIPTEECGCTLLQG